MEIRRAVKEDIKEIEILLYQVHKIHSDKRPDIFKKGSKKYTLSELEDLISDDDKPVFVAVEKGAVLGYAFCIFKNSGNNSMNEMKTLYIDDLCVSEKERGRNIGTSLYKYVLDIAKQNKCYNVTLNVWEGNDSAKKFYDKCGLKVQKYTMEKIIE